MKILIIDDDDDTLYAISRSFKKDSSVEVTTADRIAPALEHVKSGNFDAVLTDIRLGLESGIDFMESVRKDLKSDVVIVAMSCAMMPENREAYIEAGASYCLAKPFKGIEVLPKLRELVDKLGY